jgi:putative hemolysin
MLLRPPALTLVEQTARIAGKQTFCAFAIAQMASRPVCASGLGVTPFPWTDLLTIIGLVVLNGVFAMSELAIVSAKTSALEAKADSGSTSARIAIALAADPGKFLSTVQIGITLIGIIAGAYSGASLGGPMGERLDALGLPERNMPTKPGLRW